MSNSNWEAKSLMDLQAKFAAVHQAELQFVKKIIVNIVEAGTYLGIMFKSLLFLYIKPWSIFM